MKINGIRLITVTEMAEEEQTSTNTIKQRLHNYDIKPLSKDALYYYSDFEKIKGVKAGRRPNVEKQDKSENKSRSKKAKK